jgi:glutathione S-transferase
MAPLTLKYLSLGSLGGRGGTVRFFMLIHGVDFEDELIPLSEWGAVKAKMIESKENPSGTVPVLTVNDDGSVPELTQHISLCRYIFRTKISGIETTPLQEMIQDMIADEYHGWRNDWVATVVSEDTKPVYKAEKLGKYMTLFQALYEKYATSQPFLNTTKPLWADVAVASLIYDNIQTGWITHEDLKAYPKLEALYDGFCAIGPVIDWMDKVSPKVQSLEL